MDGNYADMEIEDEEFTKSAQWHDNASNSDQSFTLNLNVYEDDVYGECSSSSDLVIATNDEATDKCEERAEKRKRRLSFENEIPIVFQNMEDEIERQLVAKATKSKLSVSNVRNILKSVITNEDVMAMVRHSMQEGGEDENWPRYEPKLTRAKAKELMKSQPEIALPLYTPKKKQSECHILIDKELSEDSSDDEYKPHDDEQEQSEDEKSSMADSMSSPARKDTVRFPSSPDFRSLDSSFREEETVVNVECGTQTCWSEDGIFKIPQPRQEMTEREEENIGQRTRSKLCLNDTPLAVIENAFIPPDITTDMYDSDCDDEDWKSFLKDFALNDADNENIEDDDLADPEYNVLADFEIQSVDEEELRVDKAVKISRKEKKVLMAEAHEPLFSDDDDNLVLQQFFPPLENTCADLIPNMNQAEEPSLETGEIRWDNPPNTNECYVSSAPEQCCEPIPQENNAVNVDYVRPVSLSPPHQESNRTLITPTQLAIFQQQMRQYVQFLAQNFLQTYNHPLLNHYAEKFRSLLVNLRCLALNKVNSNFEAMNLNWAIELIEQWVKRLSENPDERTEIENFFLKEVSQGKVVRKRNLAYKEKLPKQVMEVIANSKVFIYPLLLPEMGFRSTLTRRFMYNLAEERLIALGLEQFLPFLQGKEHGLRKVINDVVGLIHKNMLPFMNYLQTKRHIINSRYRKDNNPIHYYFQHGKAPETSHYVFPIDCNNIKCPKEQREELLPEMWANFVLGTEKKEKRHRARNPGKRYKSSSKKYAIPVLLLGEFPDEKVAEAFGQGTLDYSLLDGKAFRMLPSMPLISNVSKDIVECASLSSKFPKVFLTVENVNKGKKSTEHIGLPSLCSPPNSTSKRSSPMKQVTPILKKYNSHRKGKGGKNNKNITAAVKGSKPTQGKPTPRNIAPKPFVVIVPSEEINFQEVTSTTTDNPVNICRMEDVNLNASDSATEKSPGAENIQQTTSVADSTKKKGNEKKDNEDELAALMLASSTIRVPGSNHEKKRKSKQQRDTDANLALLSPEKGSAVEERETAYAENFFKKMREKLDNVKEEGSNNAYKNLVSTLVRLGEEKANDTSGKPNDKIDNVIDEIMSILAPHNDLVEEFPVFLTSKQALLHGCLASHIQGVQMRDFIQKLEVYFAKQPSQINKIMAVLTVMMNNPNTSLDKVKEDVIPFLKGNSILLNKLLQLMPAERPPDSLMTDFEELEFWDEMEPMGDEERVEVVRLPEGDPEDRFGGEGCACSCHASSLSDASQIEKDTCRSSHCNRCGLKFVNGRVVLQTAKGIRPARVVFDSPAEFQRVVVKDVQVQPPRLSKGRSRKKSKVSDNKDDSTSPPPKVRVMHGTESEDEVGAVKLSELTASPRTQPRSTSKAARALASKGKDSKTSSSSNKSAAAESNQPLATVLTQKQDCNSGVVSSCSSEKASLTSIVKITSSSEQQTSMTAKSDNFQFNEKTLDKLGFQGNNDGETRQSAGSSKEELSNKAGDTTNTNDSSSTNENGCSNSPETPWTREEDRIILQTFQADGGKSDTLVKIGQKLPGRSVEEIASRFHKLMTLFRKMTGPSTATSESEDMELDKKV